MKIYLHAYDTESMGHGMFAVLPTAPVDADRARRARGASHLKLPDSAWRVAGAGSPTRWTQLDLG
jgi:hypothetical protein